MYLDKNWQGEWEKVFTTPRAPFSGLQEVLRHFGKAAADEGLSLAFAYRMGEIPGAKYEKKQKTSVERIKRRCNAVGMAGVEIEIGMRTGASFVSCTLAIWAIAVSD